LEHKFVTQLPTFFYASLQLLAEMILQTKEKVNKKLINTFLKTCEGQASELQVWTCPKSFSSLRLPDFKKVGT